MNDYFCPKMELRDINNISMLGLAHIGETDLVLGVGAVAQVHAGHVDAGVDDRADHLVRLGGGAQGGDDLRASH